MTDGQRDMLTIGLYQIRNEMLEYEGLARASSNFRATYARAQTCQNSSPNLTKALRTPFKNDLLEAMDEAWDGAYSDPRSMEFLKLLPVVKQAVDTMTADDIHERWNDGSDRRSVNQRCVDYKTESFLTLSKRLVSPSTNQMAKRSSKCAEYSVTQAAKR